MLDVITDIIIRYVDVPKESITADTMFFADLRMDSFEILNMICKMEEEFDVELPASDLKNIYTVGDLVLYIEAKKR